ncbi:splicing factor 3B subunit 1 isoform X1 [Stomoxys calcitrans]|uniref:splicing factor 3B subunit 1 isoform X1 n=1 Tax=Stomoxys calcitrans TaxID=35570 RepID=UPI0027E2189D|nr:splicing factor 3B subunit 1 isoform X1 [Stomoxys calcitrans]
MENIPRTHEDIEAQIVDIQSKKKEVQKSSSDGVSLLASGNFYDTEFYDEGKGKNRYEGYNTSIAANEDADEDEDEGLPVAQKRVAYTAPKSVIKDIMQGSEDVDPMADRRRPTIADREDEYKQKRRRIIISPDRADPFADGGKTPDVGSRTYTDIMREQMLKGEESELRKRIMEKSKDGTLLKTVPDPPKEGGRKRGRWDQTVSDSFVPAKVAATPSSAATPTWEEVSCSPSLLRKHLTLALFQKTPADHRWDETPAHKTGSETPGATPGLGTRMWDATPAHAMTPGHETPGHEKSVRRNRWDETPKTERETPGHSGWAETPKPDRGTSDNVVAESTPGASKRRSRWDETPSNATPTAMTPSMTPSMTPHATPGHATPMLTPGGTTPIGVKAMAMATPTPGALAAMTPEQLQAYRWEKEIDERNRPFTDEELDQMFPAGYKILPPPAGYVPLRTPGRKLMATPTPIAGTPAGFFIQVEDKNAKFMDNQPKGQNLPFMKPEDAQYFDKLLVDVDEDSLSADEIKERKIMKLLLTIKNGSPPMRKSALRQITDKAREFGAGPLFNQILPLLMSPTLEDQERHLLVKVIDRVLYKLDDLVRPYVHKILVVIEPLLIDEDYYARIEGREIISNLAKAAGLATMISTMRPDIDNIDEYVRNTTARAFAVVASALGIPSLLPFLKAVCKSKKSWQARHTGIKIVQQIAILMGCAILPHLKALVEIIEHGLVDEQQKVRTITALAIAALAEAATPYGIESFDSVLKPLWKGIRTHRGKGLAAFLKAIGYLIPLMDAEYANYYTREVMLILIREFQSPDEEMKKIVLKVVKQCCATDGVEAQYIKEEILPHFFKFFWNHRMALDRRNYRQLVDTTVEIANKVGASEIINRIVDDLKDENEQYRKMVMETIEKIMGNLGAADIDSRLEEQLIDGILYAFQEQTTEDVVMLNGFGTIVNQLGKRVKPYLPQICGTILWRLNNKSAKVRQQAADLISRIAVVMKTCQEEKLMGHLGVVLYEYLGEEYPEVLGSILGALKAIVNVIGMTKMTPPIKDLLPRLTPILKNRHEKVQENCIDLVGRIADRGPEYVSAREWMRICFELLELLKAHKKAIRRATVNTFGYIAKAIGPHDVLATLLNNLKVQERQNRVCTTVAIAIVAETCRPFTVLPALMNEYRVPELNVQNGVLKSLSFLFEYIGEMGKDYIYAVCPLLEDALMDRDLVHRQTACAAIKHMSLGVYGFGCEDALVHLLNYVWPNIFETSPHLVQAFMDAVEGLRVSLGPIKILQYTLQGLFHPARKVRDVYWKIYNSLYIGGQDALIAGYPRITNDPKNQYERYELDYSL